MSNTPIRIISAVVMIALISLSLFIHISLFKGLLLLIGLVVIDELFVNFLRRKRFSWIYLLTEVFFIIAYWQFVFVKGMDAVLLWGSLVINLILLIYLFAPKGISQFSGKMVRKIPFLIGVYLFFSLYPIAWLVSQRNGLMLLCVYFLTNFGMDTGGWFFGKNWGRHKLWPAVSPKKSVEGLIGGILAAGVLGALSWNYFVGQATWYYFVVFCLLGAISQLGDLVQSKIKRQVVIKDSSKLIPGHGGVFDRIDSLIFMTPFFIYLVQV